MQRLHECIRRVGVIHENRRSERRLAEIFQTPLGPSKSIECGEDNLGLRPERNRQPCRDKRIRDLESASKGQLAFKLPPAIDDSEPLLEATSLSGLQ